MKTCPKCTPTANKNSVENKNKGPGVVSSIVSVIFFVSAGIFGIGIQCLFQGDPDAGSFMLLGVVLGSVTMGSFLLYAKASAKK